MRGLNEATEGQNFEVCPVGYGNSRTRCSLVLVIGPDAKERSRSRGLIYRGSIDVDQPRANYFPGIVTRLCATRSQNYLRERAHTHVRASSLGVRSVTKYRRRRPEYDSVNGEGATVKGTQEFPG